MIIIHEDGYADVLHVEREDYLKFAQILSNLAGQFLHSYQTPAPETSEAAPAATQRRKAKQTGES